MVPSFDRRSGQGRKERAPAGTTSDVLIQTHRSRGPGPSSRSVPVRSAAGRGSGRPGDPVVAPAGSPGRGPDAARGRSRRGIRNSEYQIPDCQFQIPEAREAEIPHPGSGSRPSGDSPAAGTAPKSYGGPIDRIPRFPGADCGSRCDALYIVAGSRLCPIPAGRKSGRRTPRDGCASHSVRSGSVGVRRRAPGRGTEDADRAETGRSRARRPPAAGGDNRPGGCDRLTERARRWYTGREISSRRCRDYLVGMTTRATAGQGFSGVLPP